ncbi:MAG: S-adenosylmethionine:tRNA ribosyltransferase-isomerase, partial [Proteiniphilum sp.]
FREKGIQTAEVTLHVGAGTFKPVKSVTMEGHDMHTEFISVSRTTLEKLRDHPGRLVVVGTTSARTVESLYYIGKKLHASSALDPERLAVEQWEPYEEEAPIAPRQALQAILHHLDRTGEARLSATTRLMIAPGYRFHFPDALITNFHQPRSTLLLLVSAFVGEEWRTVYRFALANDFRFLSYGDGSLLWKKSK